MLKAQTRDVAGSWLDPLSEESDEELKIKR